MEMSRRGWPNATLEKKTEIKEYLYIKKSMQTDDTACTE